MYWHFPYTRYHGKCPFSVSVDSFAWLTHDTHRHQPTNVRFTVLVTQVRNLPITHDTFAESAKIILTNSLRARYAVLIYYNYCYLSSFIPPLNIHLRRASIVVLSCPVFFFSTYDWKKAGSFERTNIDYAHKIHESFENLKEIILYYMWHVCDDCREFSLYFSYRNKMYFQTRHSQPSTLLHWLCITVAAVIHSQSWKCYHDR